MTLVSNDPSWWPLINSALIFSYFSVAASIGVMYDWVITFGQEVELIWRQRWSLMTFMYLSVRYLGIIYVIIEILANVLTISVTDVGCKIMYITVNCTSVVINAILGVIMIARLHAMYQQSRKVLILLVVVFLAVTITDGVVAIIRLRLISGEELILSGTYVCTVDIRGDKLSLDVMSWTITTVWEVLALCLAVWIAVTHFRELRRHSAGGIIGDCFTVLMKTHAIYFASFIAVSCLEIVYFTPTLSANPYSLETQIYVGFCTILQVAQMFVLGPRLILAVREYTAKAVTNSDAATAMISIVWQERVHVSTSSSV